MTIEERIKRNEEMIAFHNEQIDWIRANSFEYGGQTTEDIVAKEHRNIAVLEEIVAGLKKRL